MSLRAAIHERWKNSVPLNAKIPHTRFFTGNAPDPDSGSLPYAYLDDNVADTEYDSSDTIIETHAVRFGVISSYGAEAKQAIEVVQHEFEDESLIVMTGSDRLMAVYQGPNNLEESEIGAWEATQDYTMLVERSLERVES